MSKYKMTVTTKEELERKELTKREAIREALKEYVKRRPTGNPIQKAVWLFIDKNLESPLTSRSLEKLIDKIEDITGKEYTSLKIINHYPVTPYYFLDRILLEYTFTMLPPDEFDVTKEYWTGDEKEYLNFLSLKNCFDEKSDNKDCYPDACYDDSGRLKSAYIDCIIASIGFTEDRMLIVRNQLASLLGMSEREVKQKSLFKGYGNKYEKILNKSDNCNCSKYPLDRFSRFRKFKNGCCGDYSSIQTMSGDPPIINAPDGTPIELTFPDGYLELIKAYWFISIPVALLFVFGIWNFLK